jgi:hypothetical protein
MMQTAALCPRLEDADTFFMERHSPSSSNSGWIIGCAEPIHDHLHGSEMVRAPLYEIVARLGPTVAAFLGLPVGTKVLKRPHGLWISCNGRSHQIRGDSFLGHLVSSGRDQKLALVSIDDSHNLLRLPPGGQVPCYIIYPVDRLNVRCQLPFQVVAPPEITALGICKPNTALLLARNLHWRESWIPGCGADFDLTKTPTQITQKNGPENPPVSGKPNGNSLIPGEELILIVGYSDSGPYSITHGAVAAMWSARLKVAEA